VDLVETMCEMLLDSAGSV